MNQELLSAALAQCANVHHGDGKLSVLGDTLKELDGEALVFTDTNGYGPCGAEAYVEGLGELRQKMKVVQYAGKALPLEEVEEVYDKVRDMSGVKLVVAIGGGTIMDLAKAIAVGLSHKAACIDDVIEKRVVGNTIDLLFVPTTAGTGSEATTFAVIYKEKVKYSLDHPTLLPGCVVLDESLLKSLPKPVLYATVLDALAHATESTWARGATDESREYSRLAIELLMTNTLPGYQLGSHLAGKAINISKTTLSHAMSYPMSAHFGVPHGVACFLTLPHVAKYNYEATEATLSPGYTSELLEKVFKLLFSAFAVSSIDDLQSVLAGFLEKFNVPSSLEHYGIKAEDLDMLSVKSINKGRSDNNPRRAEPADCLSILNAARV